MADKFDTPLANVYQKMVDDGLVVPVAEAGRFRYPSVLRQIDSFTTYGTIDTTRIDALTGVARAELESGSK